MLAVLLLLAAAIRDPGATLRAACDTSAEIVAHLPPAQPVEIKFALAGEGCYKITTTLDGHPLSGWLSTGSLTAPTASIAPANPAPPSKPKPSRARATAAAPTEFREAIRAIEANEPGRALSLLEPAAKATRDPGLLTLTGIAAWRNDEPRAALDYWRRSLDLHPDPQLDALYHKVERESAADRSSGRMLGLRILLRYEPGQITEEVARALLVALDSEFARIHPNSAAPPASALSPSSKAATSYFNTTGAAEWSGGQYDGRIRVALLDSDGISPQTRRAFAHELVHACLSTLGSWPAWLQEGLAQKLSGDRLHPAQWERLRPAIEAGHFPPLEHLGDGLSTAPPDRARDIYAIALHAADELAEQTQATGLRNVLANPNRLAQITAELNRKLGLTP